MKILHLYHKTYNSGDGITNVVEHLSLYQNKIMNITSKYFAFSSDSEYEYKKEFGFNSFSKLKEEIKNYNPDYTYIHGVFKIKIPLLIYFLKKTNTKIILVPHCSLMKKTLSHKWFKKYIYLFLFYFISFKKVHAIHFLNTQEKENSLKIDKKIYKYILPNGVPYPNKVEKNFKSLHPFYLGRCDIHHKGLDLLIKILNIYFSNNKTLLFNIYGARSDEKLALENLLPNPNIIINPPIFGSKKNTILTDNNIFIMTSRYEGLPISVLEALSFGNICILTSGTNMAHIVKEYNCGFYVRNINEIPDILNKIKKMPTNELVIMSNNGINLIKEKYSWESISRESIKILESTKLL